MPEIQAWEERLAWEDEFDDVVEKEQKPVIAPEIDLQEQQEVKPSDIESRESMASEDDQEVSCRNPAGKRRVPRMLKELAADGESSFWGAQAGELPEVARNRRTRKVEKSPESTSSTNAMVSTVYMVEPGPSSYKQAMESPDAEEWQAAVDSECSSIIRNKVLEFVDSIPPEKKSIPTRLILQRKLNPAGETTRYKAR